MYLHNHMLHTVSCHFACFHIEFVCRFLLCVSFHSNTFTRIMGAMQCFCKANNLVFSFLCITFLCYMHRRADSCQWEKQLQGGSGSSMTPAKQETTVWDNVILRNYKYYKLGNFGTFCCMLLNQNTDRLKNTSRSSSSFRLGLWQQNQVVEGKIVN